MFLPGDKIPMSAGPGSNSWAGGPGLVDDPRSSKKCMALSQAKVSASNPLLGTSKEIRKRWVSGTPESGDDTCEIKWKGRNFNQKYSTRIFLPHLEFLEIAFDVRSEWFLYMFITVWSYLISWMDDMLPVMDSFWPTSRSWFSNQLQDVQGFIAMAMLTQDVIEDHTNLAISSWFIIFPTI